MDLDSLDHQIMTLLAQDGRATNVQIGLALRVSHSTVKKRVDRLVDGGALRVLALVDPASLGYRTHVVLLLKTEPGAAAGIANTAASFPEVYWVGRLMGSHDLFVEAVLPGPEVIFDLTARAVGRIPGVTALDTLVALRQTEWRPVERRVSAASRSTGRADRWEAPAWRGEIPAAHRRGITAREQASTPIVLDDVDLRIMTLLQENGRRPAAEIGRLVRLSQPAVQNRIERMIARGVCKVVGVIEPSVRGLPVGGHIYLHADPDKIVEVGENLLRMPQISWLCHTTGAYDLLAEVHMASTDDILEFAGRTLASVPGIRSTETSLVVGRDGWRPTAWRPPAA